jgi:DNA-binding NtrC family response regulator
MCEKDVIEPKDLPGYLQATDKSKVPIDVMLNQNKKLGFKEKLELYEKEIIRQALEETKGNKTQAAKKLGFTLRTLRNKANKYDI